MRDVTTLPGIYAAALEIAYDNGGIHRERSEETHREELMKFLEAYDADDTDLRGISDFLSAITKDDLQRLCCGDDEEQASTLAMAPNELQPKIDGLLTDIFNEVC